MFHNEQKQEGARINEEKVTVRTSAPGKVILHGEHSVVYGKLALAASLGLRTSFELNETNLPSVATVQLASLDFVHTYNLTELKKLLKTPPPLLNRCQSDYNFTNPEFIDHSRFVTLIDRYVNDWHSEVTAKQKAALLVSFTLKIDSDLTLSAGTGSSASYSVTIAAGFLQYVKLKCQQNDGVCVKRYEFDSNVNSFHSDELEIISKWGYAAEKIIHGTPSGIDNTICTYGSMVEFCKGTNPKLVNLNRKFRLLLINTKIPRDTKVLVTKVAALRQKQTKIVDAILDVMETVTSEALSKILTINGLSHNDPVIFEEYDRLGELFDINHNLLRSLGVSHPRLDEICTILADFNLKGKLTGAGGGGYAISLLPPSVKQSVIDSVIAKLQSEGFDVILTDLGGEGVIVHETLRHGNL